MHPSTSYWASQLSVPRPLRGEGSSSVELTILQGPFSISVTELIRLGEVGSGPSDPRTLWNKLECQLIHF